MKLIKVDARECLNPDRIFTISLMLSSKSILIKQGFELTVVFYYTQSIDEVEAFAFRTEFILRPSARCPSYKRNIAALTGRCP